MPDANKGKHIVFDSDDEVDNDSENTAPQKANLFDEDSDDESGSEGKKAEGEKVKNQTYLIAFYLVFLVIIKVEVKRCCYLMLLFGLCRN